MRDYQLAFVKAIEGIVGANWVRRRPAISILDMGCDPSGRQLKEIAKYTRGQVVGINIGSMFPTEEAIAVAGPQVSLQNMSGLELDFPDRCFDLVISANVIEHVPDPAKFIQEASRVLKPGGVCYMEAAPVWNGPRGHHVMECMVAESCPWESRFIDDGSIIPDWSHLYLSRSQMSEVIGDKIDVRTKEWVLTYLYDSNDLNKVSWEVIERAFADAFAIVQIHENILPDADRSKMPADGGLSCQTYGFHATCRLRSQSGIMKRINWRLRRLGF